MPLPENNLLFGFEPRLTVEQREYVNAIFDNQLVMVNAKAGTGKTTLAVACEYFGVAEPPIRSVLSHCLAQNEPPCCWLNH